MSTQGLWLGAILGASIAAVGYFAGSLTLWGALAAAVVGALTLGGGGALPAALLVTFFVTSSALSRLGRGRKNALGSQFEKTSRRDQGQVLANGSVAAVLAVVYGASGAGVALAGLSGALAAMTADTWATEIGVLARRAPVRLTDGRRVQPGTSGAVTPEGMAAAAAGSAMIAVLAAGGSRLPGMAVAVFLAGLAGALFDSVLGATVQAIFECPACGTETEWHPYHKCGTPTRRVRGWPWLRNDGVNWIASVFAAAVAGILYLVVYR